MSRSTTHIPGAFQYKPGDKWKECPRCGFDVLESKLVLEAHTGKKVCKYCVDDPPEALSKARRFK